MIARPLPRPGPIPFANATLQTAPSAAVTAWPQGGPPPSRMTSQAHKHSAPLRPPPHDEATHLPKRPLHATFLGHGLLSVRSSASGALYRFDGHGARLPIDPRDALLLGRLTDVHVD